MSLDNNYTDLAQESYLAVQIVSYESLWRDTGEITFEFLFIIYQSINFMYKENTIGIGIKPSPNYSSQKRRKTSEEIG